MNPFVKALCLLITSIFGTIFYHWPGWALLGPNWSPSMFFMIFLFNVALVALLAAIFAPSE